MPASASPATLNALHARFAPAAVLVVATTSKVAEVPVPLRRCFTTELAVPALDEAQRGLALRHTLGDAAGLSDGDVRSAAQGSAGFLPCDVGATACDAVLHVMLAQAEKSGKLSGAKGAAAAPMVRACALPSLL